MRRRPASQTDVTLGDFSIRCADVCVHELPAEPFVEVVVRLYVVDVKTREPNEVVNRQRIHVKHWAALGESCGALIRSQVIAAVTHEVDEWLKVDGKRVRDPHPEVKRERMAAEMAGLPGPLDGDG